MRADRRTCTPRSTDYETADATDGSAQGGAAVCRRADLDAVADIAPDVAAGVRAHFSDDEAPELTLDVMRNAGNKIAVSLAADAPRVAEGTERYVIDADGQTCSPDVDVCDHRCRAGAPGR